jgi:type IV secretion system protein VirB8
MRDIDAKIEDGTYFVEAKKWYNDIFLRPAVMNAVMRFVAYVVVCVSVISLYNISKNFPLVRKINVMAYLNNTAQYYPVIRKLDVSEGVRKSVVSYLSEKYIKARETYSPDFFLQDYYFIQKSSEKAVFDSYYNNLKDHNNEALELFKKGSSVEILPLSTEYDAKKSQVYIKFEKKIVSQDKKVQQNAQFMATMSFYMSSYDFNEPITKEINFIVTSYKLDPIKT